MGKDLIPSLQELRRQAGDDAKVRFNTKADLIQIYDACKTMGLKVIGIKGQRIYGRLVSGKTMTDGSPRFATTYTGSATVRYPVVRKGKQVGWLWNGEEELEGEYTVTVSLPRS